MSKFLSALSVLLVITACQSEEASPVGFVQEAVTHTLKEGAGCRIEEFGPVLRYSRKDSARGHEGDFEGQLDSIQLHIEHVRQVQEEATTSDKPTTERIAASRYWSDSAQQLHRKWLALQDHRMKLLQETDTAAVGHVLWVKYWPSGAIQPEKKRFVVYSNGKVEQIR